MDWLRWKLVNLLVGDSSYAKNLIFVKGEIVVRPFKNYITCCTFLNGSKVSAEPADLNKCEKIQELDLK